MVVAAERLGIELRIPPAVFERQAKNTTALRGREIYWHVEWVFKAAGVCYSMDA